MKFNQSLCSASSDLLDGEVADLSLLLCSAADCSKQELSSAAPLGSLLTGKADDTAAPVMRAAKRT
ncbi:MAG: hypothetical protein FWG83_05895 [Oscillospiraceae bacterium]|nr:hypothetical protein [Oscillospiraceae bacterium]